MGKRKKSSRGPVKRLKQKLDVTFSCLFCNHENAVICNMDKRLGIGSLSCKVCGQSFQASINALSEPIDVYSEWVDACEAVQSKGAAVSSEEEKSTSVSSAAAKVEPAADELSDLDEDEDFD